MSTTSLCPSSTFCKILNAYGYYSTVTNFIAKHTSYAISEFAYTEQNIINCKKVNHLPNLRYNKPLQSNYPAASRLLPKPITSFAGGNEASVIFCNRSYSTHKRDTLCDEQMDAPDGIFKGCVDRFNGITIDSESEYNENDDFAAKLEKSLNHWIENKMRCLWFKVRTRHAEWVPHLIKQNFDFHHGSTGFVVLCRWLPNNETSNLPQHAHTMLGCGGLVINDKNEVLVVSEKNAMIPNSWKLPGGYIEPKENIVQGAIREVKEETGIDCEFDTVVSLRHSHGGTFGFSDLYIVVGLKPLTTKLIRDEREIADLKWMPVDEYLQHSCVHETNRKVVRIYLDYKKRNIRFTVEKATHKVLKKEYSMFYVKALEEDGEKKSCVKA